MSLALFAAFVAAFVPAFVAALFSDDVNRPTKRLLFFVTVGLILCSALMVLGTATRRGMTLAVWFMVGLEALAAGALLCVDRHLNQAQVRPTAKRAYASLPLRALFASVMTLGAALLALYHVGSLQKLGAQVSEALEVVTPSEFDPLILVRKPRPRDCILGAERPTFKKDQIVSCLTPHDWQVLSRIETSEECPDGATLTANGMPVTVIPHDLPYDRWCLARSSTGQQLTSPVCEVGLACTS